MKEKRRRSGTDKYGGKKKRERKKKVNLVNSLKQLKALEEEAAKCQFTEAAERRSCRTW